MHYFQLYFDKELNMFQTDLVSLITSLNTVFTATGWNLTLLADRQHN